MNNITELVLIESRSARNSQISDVTDERAFETLNKAKALVMALWQGTGIATNAQLAEYFEISEDLIRQVHKRNRDELQLDGVQVLKGEKLKDLLAIGSDSLSQSPNRITSLTVWTPRAALRLGMLLQDSPVARQVRTVILDIVEEALPQKTSIFDEILSMDYNDIQRVIFFQSVPDDLRLQNHRLLQNISYDALQILRSATPRILKGLYNLSLIDRYQELLATYLLNRNSKIFANKSEREISVADNACDVYKLEIAKLKEDVNSANRWEILEWLEPHM